LDLSEAGASISRLPLEPLSMERKPMTSYFTKSMTYEWPEPHHKLCLQFDMVTLQQRGRDNFAVRYGKEVYAGLSYSEACKRLGQALMHQGACNDLLDNRAKGER
jgi:hypothetical protein